MLSIRVVLILLLFSICVGAVHGAEVAVCTNSSDQINPDVYGNYVVWEDHRTDFSRIYLYDITAGTAAPIDNPRLLSSQSEPAIYGDAIVYVSRGRGGDEIVLYSIAHKTTETIRQSTATLETPDVYYKGDLLDVVWTEHTPNATYGMDNTDIYLYTKGPIGLAKTTRVSTGLYDSAPRISGNDIVWMHRIGSPMESTINDNYEVHARTGSSGSPTLISSADEWNTFPDIQGDRAVWANSMFYDGYGRHVLLSALPPGAGDPVTVAEYPDTSLIHHAYERPVIFGTIMVYVDRNLSSGERNLQVTELGSETEYRLTSSNHASSPRIYQDTVVWVDDRAGNKDIYMKKTGPTPITGCTVIDEPGYYTLPADIINSACPVAIDIRSSDVLLDGQGHTVEGVDSDGSIGIRCELDAAAGEAEDPQPIRNIRVRSIVLTDWSTGIDFTRAGNCSVDHVSIRSCVDGIHGWWDVDYLAIKDTESFANANAGVFLEEKISAAELDNVTLSENGVAGFVGKYASATLRDSVVSRNGWSGTPRPAGLYLFKTTPTIEGCIIEGNHGAGIDFVSTGGGGRVVGNRIAGNDVGFLEGDVLGEGGWRTVYNNYFNNTVNAAGLVPNTWNIAASTGPNVVGGLSIGGNYWALPGGQGFSETHADVDGDGFCDEAYTINDGVEIGGEPNIDHLPLSRPGAVSSPTPVPGGAGSPHDLDINGKYEDVNGNGRADFADVVLYFNQMSWIAANEPVAMFDYNGNGRIDFADVVWLFNNL
jgi:beta propeller repeat protein